MIDRIFLIFLLCLTPACNPPSLVDGGDQQKDKGTKAQEGVIGDNAITALYLSFADGIDVYIPPSEITDSFDLRDLLKKYDILSPYQISDRLTADKINDRFIKANKKIIKNSKGQDVLESWQVAINKLPQLLEDAKTIIRSFLLTNDNDLAAIKEHSIEKHGLNRLFTYAKLRQVIQEKKLSHVKLPRKILVIKNRINGQYISSKITPDIINKLLKLKASVLYPFNVTVIEDTIDSDYELIIYAEKIKNHEVRFNDEAKSELITLVKEDPFDIGFGNIFTDSNGDAVIIDTEYKGEVSEHSVKKLIERYFK
jgi:hypothetical protein